MGSLAQVTLAPDRVGFFLPLIEADGSPTRLPARAGRDRRGSEEEESASGADRG
jgi:hypothetical protein